MSRIEMIVTRAVTGADLTLFHAEGARLKPMSETIAPVTMGGMRRSIQPAPAKWTMTPTTSSEAPAKMTPPCASEARCGSMAVPPPAT